MHSEEGFKNRLIGRRVRVLEITRRAKPVALRRRQSGNSVTINVPRILIVIGPKAERLA